MSSRKSKKGHTERPTDSTKGITMSLHRIAEDIQRIAALDPAQRADYLACVARIQRLFNSKEKP